MMSLRTASGMMPNPVVRYALDDWQVSGITSFSSGTPNTLAVALALRLLPQPAMPIIGFVNTNSPQSYARQLAAFLKGLGETGYVDGRNVVIEYRWADDQFDRLPGLAADLVRHQNAVRSKADTQTLICAILSYIKDILSGKRLAS